MGNIGWTGIIIIAILVVILFGKGKISSIMGDLAKKGLKALKKVCQMTVTLVLKIPIKIQTTQIPKINNLICLR